MKFKVPPRRAVMFLQDRSDVCEGAASHGEGANGSHWTHLVDHVLNDGICRLLLALRVGYVIFTAPSGHERSLMGTGE